MKTETKTGIHQVKEKRKAWTRQYSCKQIDPAHCFYGNVSSGKSGDKKKKRMMSEHLDNRVCNIFVSYITTEMVDIT